METAYEDRLNSEVGTSAASATVYSSARASRDGAPDADWMEWALHESLGCEQPCEPEWLWSTLCAGRLRISEIFEVQGSTFAILDERLPRDTSRPDVTSRRIEVLQRRLLGDSEKAIAYHFGLSSSTICGEIQRALSIVCRDPRLPGLTMLLARLYYNATSPGRLDARLTRILHGGVRYFVLTVPQLEVDPAHRLAPAEREICGLFLRGSTHHEIARARGTRPRTVSNQIASIFQKFNVSGRMTLMAELIRLDLHGAPTAAV